MIGAITLLDELANEFVQTAEVMHEHGAHGEAEAVEACARKIRARMKGHLEEPLLISAAAEEFPWSDRFLRDAVKAGKIRPVGGDGPRRVRRRDLYGLAGNGH